MGHTRSSRNVDIYRVKYVHRYTLTVPRISETFTPLFNYPVKSEIVGGRLFLPYTSAPDHSDPRPEPYKFGTYSILHFDENEFRAYRFLFKTHGWNLFYSVFLKMHDCTLPLKITLKLRFALLFRDTDTWCNNLQKANVLVLIGQFTTIWKDNKRLRLFSSSFPFWLFWPTHSVLPPATAFGWLLIDRLHFPR